MPAQHKIDQVHELAAKLEGAVGMVFTDYRGLKVGELQELRRRLRPRGIEYHVVKNTLMRRAASERGLGDLTQVLVGPTAVATTATDEVELARGIVEETRALRSLRISGGVLGGRVVAAEEIQMLATLPGRTELQAAIVGTLEAPLSQLINTMHAPLRQLVHVLGARAA